MEKFKDKIKALRQKRGITQQRLADNLKVSKQAVSKWEKGHSLPDVTSVEIIASYFGVSTDYLLNDEAEISGEEKRSGFLSAFLAKEKLIMRVVAAVLLAAVIALSVSLGVVLSRSRVPETVNVNGWKVTLLEYEKHNSNHDSYWAFKFYVYNDTEFEKHFEDGDVTVAADNSELLVTDDIYTGYMRIVKPKNGEYLNVKVYIYRFNEHSTVTLYYYGTPILKFSYTDYGQSIKIKR